MNENLEIYQLIFVDMANHKTKRYQQRVADLIKQHAIRNVGPDGWTILSRECDICIKQLPSAQHLVPHRFTHTFDLGYTCLICQQTYDNKTLLSEHLLQHKRPLEHLPDPKEGPLTKPESNFVCILCDHAYTRRETLYKHLQSPVHNVKRYTYKCNVPRCIKAFDSQALRDGHRRSHDCPVCFKTYLMINKHIRLHNETLKCDLCKKLCATDALLKLHRKLHDCSICSQTFVFIRHVKPHELKHQLTPYTCDICQVVLPSELIGQKHRRMHDCRVCFKTFTLFGNCRAHELIHEGDASKTFKCDICNCRFWTSNKLASHRRSHTGEKPYECGTCKKRYSSLGHRNRHRRTHVRPVCYHPCDKCEKQFNCIELLRAHTRRVHEVEPGKYKCHLCEKRFNSNSNLASHRRTHSDLKRYECDVCHKLFKSRPGLNLHAVMHTEKSFQCNVCFRRFPSARSFGEHMSIHAVKRERIYQCDLCKMRFFTAYGCRNHRKRHLVEGRHECDICHMLFVTGGCVVVHKERAHAICVGSIYRCDICQKRFKMKSMIVRHLEMKHNKLQVTKDGSRSVNAVKDT